MRFPKRNPSGCLDLVPYEAARNIAEAERLKPKQYHFTIPGRLPGLNEYTKANRSNRYAGNNRKKDAEAGIVQIIKSTLRGVRFEVPVNILYTWFERDRMRDKDNICFAKKFINDSLVKAGTLKNDGWNEIEDFTDIFKIDPKNPRVEVTIFEVID